MRAPKQPKPDRSSSSKTPARTEAERRIEREAAALRENLLRRKQQARARQASNPDTPEE